MQATAFRIWAWLRQDFATLKTADMSHVCERRIGEEMRPREAEGSKCRLIIAWTELYDSQTQRLRDFFAKKISTHVDIWGLSSSLVTSSHKLHREVMQQS